MAIPKEYSHETFQTNHRTSTESIKSALNLTVPKKEALLSSRINLFVEETKPKIPDGGWGWLVVFASFFINLVSDGVGSTFGLLNIEFLHEFQASNSATSLIGSLFLAVPLLAGPLGSALVDRYGCKYMTVLGGIICTVGFAISAYVKSIWLMYVTFGVIGGIGFCLCFVTAVVSIAFWFEKRRTLALGIAASGTGFGTVIYSPLLTYLLGEYGWRGAVLIMAGLCANMCVSGFLMRDPDWIIEDELKTCEKSKKAKSLNVAKSNYVLEDVEASVNHPKVNDSFSCSVINLPTFLKENEEVPLEVLKKLSENKKLYNIILQNYPNILSYKSASASDLLFLSDKSLHDLHISQTRIPVNFSVKLKKPLVDDHRKQMSVKIDNSKNKNGDLLDKDEDKKVSFLRSDSVKSRTHPNSFQGHHHYLRNVRFRKNSMGYRGAMLNIHKYKLAASSCPDFFKNSSLTLKEDEEEEWYDEYVEVLKDITNFSLFTELHFFLLSLSTIIMCIWFVVPFFYLPVHMTNYGYSDTEAAYALSVIGVTNIIGMVVFGIVGDKLHATKVYALCLICCGLTCAAMMFFTSNYTLLLISCGLFGLFFASCYALTPSILADLVPLDNFTMAYGLFLLCQGIGNLAGPPIAGLLYDLTESYEQSFYQAGFWVVVSGILVGGIPYTENKKIFGHGPVTRS